MNVVVLGSANLDIVSRVARLPGGGETVLALDSAEHPGGKGNNQAIAVARAGAETVFIAALGRDAAGEVLTSHLESAGVTCLLRRVDAPTGTAIITVDDAAENTIVVRQGANAQLHELMDAERQAIVSADVLLLQLESPLDVVTKAAAWATKHNTKVVLNASPVADLPAELTTCVDVLVVNEHEALHIAANIMPERVLPTTISVDSAKDIVQILLTVYPAVVITLGAVGSVVLSTEMGDSPVAHIPAFPVDPVDTTAAGDTFCGAFVAELVRGADPVSAVGFASAAGALAVQTYGAVPSIPTRDQIIGFRGARHG